ncbi:hypothetical protein QTI66_10885 [Variovorax sp. J22R133]|uniref:protealysin inhibitor emfourin n=1 Tax=Variovorax brevis TaxID=3053503 RepID=UPI00257907E5|nr:protealysin inhibitor emfourin [Variovorax sp. J22R133]MDM0112655.1 hypothetical protein [Variovorax sp. J22R133]
MSSSKAPDPPVLKSLRIERRGGIAGLKLSAEHDVAALSKAQQQALSRIVNAVPGPAGATRAPPAGADRFTYRIHVTDAHGADRTVELPEDAMPSALKALVPPTLP